MRAAAFTILLAVSASAQAPIRGFTQEKQAAQRELEQKARAVASPNNLKTYMARMATRPHVAGSDGSRAVAEYALGLMRGWGLDAKIETFEALIPYPTDRLLETTGPNPVRASLTEPAIESDPDTAGQDQIATFNAYSASGDVTAPLVYVNYGMPEDYALLESRGIDVKGKIVMARYGRVWRGLKPKLAQEHGAVGCIIYSDPRDDGFFVEDAYPDGPMRPEDGVQRGSVMDMVLYTGDPLSPGWASEPGSKRLSREESKTLMKIPVLPVSWADARLFIDLLDGPIAPEGWRGAIPTTYHLGPSKVPAHLKLDFDWTNKPLYNVIATIEGSEHPDEWVIYGNHHDAWVTGASDPVSGASVLLETARTLAELNKAGWKPKRTIKLALWDGEEYGLLGSTEWVEKHADELRKSGAVYINTDSSGDGPMSLAGSTSLERFIDDVLREIDDPRGGGLSVLDVMNGGPMNGPGPQQVSDQPLGALGSGSDYVAFLHHLGIASLNLGFGAEPGQYHSNYDTVAFYNAHSDGDRKYSVALTQILSIAMLRLSDAGAMPFAFEPVAVSVQRQIDSIRTQIPQDARIDLSSLQRDAGRLTTAARMFEAQYASSSQRGAIPVAANRAMEEVERALLLTDGLPGREWYRHSLYAPGLLTGYAAKTVPGLREALEARNWPELNTQAQKLGEALRHASEAIERVTQLLQSR